MKRCPVCEFIYEDDQSLCDMDKMELVYESEPLPLEQSTALALLPPTRKPGRRKFALLALSGILCLILFVQYSNGELRFTFSGNNQAAVESYDAPAPPVRSDVVPQPVASPLPSESPSPAPNSATKPAAKMTPGKTVPAEITPVKTATPVPKEVKRGPTHISSLPPAAEKERAKPAPGDQNNESKVSSFLKKTARVLKKPFKF